MPRRSAASIASDEIAQFSRHAEDWWNPDGVFKPLHRLNPVRLEYIRDRVCSHFARDSKSRYALKGLKILDVGCGGGLLTEPLARMGGQVTGLDASAEGIQAARAHARVAGLTIDYRIGSVEELAERYNSLPLVGRVREGGAQEGRSYKIVKDTPPPAKSKGLLRKPKISLPPPPGGRGYDLITALEIAEHVADLDSFIEALTSLLKPGGLLIMSTLNRTAKSFILGIVAAEYILGWVPKGTHQWKKFLRPSELVGRLEKTGIRTTDLTGMVFNPLRGEFELSVGDLGVNYMLAAVRERRT